MKIVIALAVVIQFAYIGAAETMTVPVWPNGVPDSSGITEAETTGRCVGNVTLPTLTAYLPDESSATGAGVLICPGGGYGVVCMEHEGKAVAQWLNRAGIAGFVLKYRLPNGHSEIPLKDAQQALKTIRASGAEWGVNGERVGVLGFSAGGHLASTVGTHFAKDYAVGTGAIEGQSVRPDFMVLIYPVVTMLDPFTHAGSRNNLLGKDPGKSQVERFSNELRVTPETPPTFIVHTVADRAVPIENSLQLHDALREHNVPVEFHAFEHGPHGFGLGSDALPVGTWPELCERWLAKSGFLSTTD